jgi:two-component system, chemotaxis family, CheB/CheR fusion protein
MASIEAVLSTAELSRRSARPPDYQAETKALLALVKVLRQSPEQVLQVLADTVLRLCGGDSAGINLLEEDAERKVFRWHAVAGSWSRYRWNTTPRDDSPSGLTLDRNRTLLFSRPHRHFTQFAGLQPLPTEALFTPISMGGQPVGTVWVVTHDGQHPFDAEDRRVLEDLATFAAFSYEVLTSTGTSEQRARKLQQHEEELQRRRAELATAEELRARLAAIVESSDDAIISKDLQGVVTSWNGGAERLFGYTAAEAIGRPITIIIPADRLHEEQTILERLKRGEPIEHFETTRVRKGGTTIEVSLTVSPVRDGSGRVIGASKTARDITERKRADEELREADRRKSEFLAILAHELRNPLAPIRNALEILRLTFDDGKVERPEMAVLDRQVGHVVRLVDDLLDLSRVSRGRIELRRKVVELTSIVNDAVEAVRPLCAEMDHELTVTLAPQRTYVNADPLRLVQALSNLLNNACKFTDRGGRIRVIVDRKGTEAVIRVQDTGVGIAAEQLSRIFEMFAQVDASLERARGGLGIGLTLVRYLVEAHGGAVEAHSAGVGQGSEFIVRLPVVPRPRPSVSPDPVGTKDAGMLRRRILVVDDNRDATETLARVLELGGHEVHTAHDGLEAVDVAAELQPDAVLLDIGLPKLNGYDAARRIREQPAGKDVFLVALTGWGQPEDRRRAQDAGFDAHLVKPVDHAHLAKLLRDRVSADRPHP